MSNHAPKIDPASKLMFIAAAVAILLTVYVLISSLINTYKKNSIKGEVDSTQLVATASKNLMPIGAAATSDAVAAAPAAARSGKEVYTAVCSVCHASGVAGAPKVGDKAAWEPRVATGLDALLNTAMNGKGAMPARGGNPSVTDDELKAVILYMTKETGFDLGGGDTAANEKPAATKEPAKKEAEKIATPAEPEKEEAVKKEAPKEPEAPAVTATPSTPEAPAMASTETSEEGKKVYDKTCFACHATGIAGSPKLGDKAAWEARIATGMDTLYATALNGKGAMPPKGGNVALSDEKVKAAVDYMVSQSK